MDFVAETFSRTIVFSEGTILVDGPTREVFADVNTLKTAHLEQPHITQIARRMGYAGVILNDTELLM